MSETIYKLSSTGLVHVQRPEGISEENLHQVDELNRDYFLGMVISIMQKVHGDLVASAYQIAGELAHKFHDAPAVVRYRLVERCLSYEFQQAPLDFLIWLLKQGVIVSSKNQPERLTELPLETVIARICLLCEFENIRNHVGRSISDVNIADLMLKNSARKPPIETISELFDLKFKNERLRHYESLSTHIYAFNIERLCDVNYIKYFFEKINEYGSRLRIWPGTLASWVGVLGAVLVEIDRASCPIKKAIYIEANNIGTITDDVAKSLKKRGLTIHGRTLYQRHHGELLGKIFKQVQVYYKIIDSNGVAIRPHFEDFFYYAVIVNTADL